MATLALAERVTDRHYPDVAGHELVDEHPRAERRARLVHDGDDERHPLPGVRLNAPVNVLDEQRPWTALVFGFP